MSRNVTSRTRGKEPPCSDIERPGRLLPVPLCSDRHRAAPTLLAQGNLAGQFAANSNDLAAPAAAKPAFEDEPQLCTCGVAATRGRARNDQTGIRD